MPKDQISVRLGELTLRKLRALAELYGTQTSALAVAIDRLYLAEVGEAPPEEDESDAGEGDE